MDGVLTTDESSQLDSDNVGYLKGLAFRDYACVDYLGRLLHYLKFAGLYAVLALFPVLLMGIKSTVLRGTRCKLCHHVRRL